MARKIPVTKKNLQEKKLAYNPHDYALDQPYIYLLPGDNGRGGHPACWNIHWKGHPYPGPWYNHGDISYTILGRDDKEAKLKMVMNRFVSEFGPSELAKTPFGSYMKKEFVEHRNTQLSELLNSTQEIIVEKQAD
jgi:hypothetical protein